MNILYDLTIGIKSQGYILGLVRSCILVLVLVGYLVRIDFSLIYSRLFFIISIVTRLQFCGLVLAFDFVVYWL